jgi:hypothetical protein
MADRQTNLGFDATEDGVGRMHVGGPGDFRQEHARDVRAHDRLKVTQDHPRRHRLDPHEIHRIRRAGRRVGEEFAHQPAGPDPRGFGARSARLLEIEEQRVRSRFHVLGDPLVLIPGRE